MAITVQPGGIAVSVTFTDRLANAVTVYSDVTCETSVSQPVSISADATYYLLPRPGKVRVLCADREGTALADAMVDPTSAVVTVKPSADHIAKLANLRSDTQTVLGRGASGATGQIAVAEQTLVGRVTGGNVAALPGATARGIVGGDVIDSGECCLDRRLVASASVSLTAAGALTLTYFTALRSESVTKLAVITGSTAAGATPTLCRMGVYSVASNGGLTLVASCASDTALFGTTFTRYERATSSWAKVAGQRYAVGVLVVTSAAVPSFAGAPQLSAAVHNAHLAIAPRVCGAVTAQTDLPESIAAGSVSDSRSLIQMEMLP